MDASTIDGLRSKVASYSALPTKAGVAAGGGKPGRVCGVMREGVRFVIDVTDGCIDTEHSGHPVRPRDSHTEIAESDILFLFVFRDTRLPGCRQPAANTQSFIVH